MLFTDVIAQLPGVECHALDFRAHGWRVRENAPYCADDLLADVQQYAQDWPRFSIVGSSIGATVAMMLARAWPDRVEKLVLTGLTVAPSTWGEWLHDTFIASVLQRVGPFAPFVSASMRLLFSSTSLRTRNVSAWKAHLQNLPGKSIAAAIRCWRDRPDMRCAPKEIAAHTLIIAGEEDLSAPPVYAEAAARRLPNASLIHLEGAGHMAPFEQPEPFAEMVRAFLTPTNATLVS